MGEQLTIMTIASHITDLGSLTPKPVLSASTLQCLHMCKQTQQEAQKCSTKKAVVGTLTEDYLIDRSDTTEKFFTLKTEPEKLSRTQSRDSKK